MKRDGREGEVGMDLGTEGRDWEGEKVGMGGGDYR